MSGNPAVSGLLLLLFMATPVCVLLYMLWLCWTRGWDPEQDSITVVYESPNNLTPAECGTLVDNAAALHNITATITDLSVKGYLTIEQKDEESPGSRKDYVFHMARPQSDWANLKLHEREVLKSIFIPTNPVLMLSEAMSRVQTAAETAGHTALSSILSGVEAKARETSELYRSLSGVTDGPRTSVSLLELQNHFSLHLPTLRDAIFDGLVAGGYYAHRPDRARMVHAVKAVFLGVLMALVGGLLASATKMNPVPLILTGLFTGVIVLGFGWFLPARTRMGARTLAKVLGFQEFLGRVEKDHIERLEKSPELFEKYLPYARPLVKLRCRRPSGMRACPGVDFCHYISSTT